MQKKSLHKETKNAQILYIIFSLCALLFFIFLFLYHFYDYSFYGIRPACGFITLFHCYCPGCGGTRAVDALLHGDVVTSFLYHPCILYGVFLSLSYYIPASYTFLLKRDGRLYHKFHVSLLWGLLIIAILHFIIRNILLLCCGIDYIAKLTVY